MSQGSLMEHGWHICFMKRLCKFKCLGLDSIVRDEVKTLGSPLEALCPCQDSREKWGYNSDFYGALRYILVSK